MAKVIAVFNRKGGATKTSTVFNVAGVLAKLYKKKVLVVDLDGGQGNLTSRFLQEDIRDYHQMGLDFFEGKVTMEDLFIDPSKVNEAIYSSRIEVRSGFLAKKRGIDIIPFKPETTQREFDYNDIERMLLLEDDRERRYSFMKNILGNIRRTRSHPYDYDYILIDFPPTLTELGYCALACVDYILCPSVLDVFSLEGFQGILNTVETLKVKGINPNVELIGLFFTRLKPVSSFDAQMIKLVKEQLGDLMMETSIRESEDIRWALYYSIPLCWAKRSSPIAKDYEMLTRDILFRIGDLPKDEETELASAIAEFEDKYGL